MRQLNEPGTGGESFHQPDQAVLAIIPQNMSKKFKRTEMISI